MTTLERIRELTSPEVELETPIDELAMDSLATLDLLIQLGIPDTAVSDLQTVGDLVRHCETA
jgi:acyl carrier protein